MKSTKACSKSRVHLLTEYAGDEVVIDHRGKVLLTLRPQLGHQLPSLQQLPLLKKFCCWRASLLPLHVTAYHCGK